MPCIDGGVRITQDRAGAMKNVGRLIVTGVVLVVAAAAVVAVVLRVSAGGGFEGCTIASGFGWVAPLLLGSVLGGATWALMTQRRSDRHCGSAEDAAPCGRCGREVLGRWRMCPYCGAMLDRGTLGASSKK